MASVLFLGFFVFSANNVCRLGNPTLPLEDI